MHLPRGHCGGESGMHKHKPTDTNKKSTSQRKSSNNQTSSHRGKQSQSPEDRAHYPKKSRGPVTELIRTKGQRQLPDIPRTEQVPEPEKSESTVTETDRVQAETG